MKIRIILKTINISLTLALIFVWFAPRQTQAVTGTNLLSDPSFEDQTCVSPAPDLIPCWQSYQGTLFSYVSMPHTGVSSIGLTNSSDTEFKGAWQKITLNQTVLNPVFIGGYVKGDNIVLGAGSWFGAGLYAEIHLTNGNTVSWNTVPNSGTFDWRWIGFNTGSLAGVNAPIAYIYIIPILKDASGTAYFDDLTVNEFSPAQGAVTLMFDDGEISTFTEAKKLMDHYNFVGVSAVISDQTDEIGFMNPTQLLTLQNAGWEIVSHSINHPDGGLITMTPAEYNNELTGSKAALQGIGLTINNFAFPGGAYNMNVIADAAKYYQSARAYELGSNSLGLYPFDVKVRSVVESTTLAEIQGWLDEAKTQNRWEIIVMHTISERGDDVWHTSPAEFNHILDAVQASALPVITYNQGIQTYAVTQ